MQYPASDEPRPTMTWVPIPRLSSARHPAQVAAEPSPSVTDEFIESYVRWREASEDVRTAHQHWAKCEPHGRRVAFAEYRAALDSEEHAARMYSDWTERLFDGSPCHTPNWESA
jgi:hypothetical protein